MMIDKHKRQTLIACTAGLFASALPLQASSAIKRLDGLNNTVEAYGSSGKLSGIEVRVSTFGIGSAVTTIKNQSSTTVTITQLGKGIVEHRHGQYDVNASLGKAGVTLKPGQRRILVAHRLNTPTAPA